MREKLVGYDEWKTRDISYEQDDEQEFNRCSQCNGYTDLNEKDLCWECAMREDNLLRGFSETSVQDHYHDCDCGAWVCNDEACEELLDISPSGRAGYRTCPCCEED